MDDGLPPGMLASAGAPTLLDRYEAIADLSRSMVLAARAQQWSEVAALEARCIELVQQLRRAALCDALAVDDQPTRVRLLRSILADDAEIRRLAEPWLAQLEDLLLPPAPPPAGH
jgi:flagellar protein FliT